MPERTPLLNRTPSDASVGNKYYFLGKASQDANYQGGTTKATTDGDGHQVVEGLPYGTSEQEFAPKILAPRMQKHPSQIMSKRRNDKPVNSAGFWGKLMNKIGATNGSTNGSGAANGSQRPYGDVGTLVKMRKAPIKIEPKVFFANERTFLAWMHLSVILAGASIAILAFAEEDDNPYSQLYGVILLPIAIAFIVYSMYQYWRRANMIRHRHPGPYEDTIGPVVLGVLLMMSITAQFALKLYAMATIN